jgi:hypothetical protein
VAKKRFFGAASIFEIETTAYIVEKAGIAMKSEVFTK